MQDIRPILRRYKIWNQHLEKLCHQIGEKELSYRPMPESNSAAWVLVHLIGNYREFIELSAPGKVIELIGSFDDPDEETLASLPFSRIFSIMQDYRHIFYEEVLRLNQTGQLDSEIPAGEDKTWLDLVYTLINHEIYHCGQLAYIARILQQKVNSRD